MGLYHLTNFEKVNGNLVITLTDEGREEIEDWDEDDTIRVIHDLIESHLCNGWEYVRPEEIGSLTSCELILTDDAERDDQGDLVRVGRVYWHERYQIEDPIKALKSADGLILKGVE